MDLANFFTQARVVSTFFGFAAGVAIGRFVWPQRQRELMAGGALAGYLCAEGVINSPFCPTAATVTSSMPNSSTPKTEA